MNATVSPLTARRSGALKGRVRVPGDAARTLDAVLAAAALHRAHPGLRLHLQQGGKRQPAEQACGSQPQQPTPGDTIAVTQGRPIEAMIEFHR